MSPSSKKKQRSMSTHANDTKGHRVATTTADTAPAAASTWGCGCGRKFDTYQAKNAHLRFCKGKKPTATATAARSIATVSTASSSSLLLQLVDDNNQATTSQATTMANDNDQPEYSAQEMAAEPAEVLATGQTNTRKRINKDQIAACFNFFKQNGYTRNKKIPRGTMKADSSLLKFILEHNLTRDQMKTQLNNYKKKEFEYYGEVYECDPEEARRIISSHLPDEPFDFLKCVINKMIKIPTDAKMKTSPFAVAASVHKYIKDTLPMMMKDPFKTVFLDIIEQYIEIGVEVFPEQAKNCDTSDATFYDKKQKMVTDKFVAFYNDIQEYDDVLNLDATLNDEGKERQRKKCWLRLYLQVEEKLFTEWCHTSYTDELPPIAIVLEGNINRHSFEVIYYTAGIILKKIGATKRKETKIISLFLFTDNKILLQTAEDEGLACGLTKVRASP